MTEFAVLHQNIPEKGSILNGKNFLPLGADSFLLEYIPFQKGDKNLLIRAVSLENVSIPLNDS